MPDATPETLRAWREGNGLSRRSADVALGLPPRSIEALEQGRVTSPIPWALLGTLLPLLDASQLAVPRREGRKRANP